tara:strand:- start:675 stop:1001 length:327 start_codon:yes stop_codon:yes gene_type:complete
MAQDFTRYASNDVGTSPVSVHTANSNDTIIGISLANITGSAINVDCYVTTGGNDVYLVKNAPIPTGSALQVLDGGAKFVLQSTDVLKVKSDTASSLDAYVSMVDAISA